MAASALRITEPSIVILTDTQAEYERLLHEEEQRRDLTGYNETTNDFLYYTNHMIKAL